MKNITITFKVSDKRYAALTKLAKTWGCKTIEEHLAQLVEAKLGKIAGKSSGAEGVS